MKRIEMDEYNKLVRNMIVKIVADFRGKPRQTGVFGVPRGGTMIAKEVSDKLTLELLDRPKPGCIVVDDLIDSGKTRTKYAEYPFYTLINKQTDDEYRGDWIEFWYEETAKDEEDLLTRMLEHIGENPNREGLQDTPKRVIKMWNEIFRGYKKSEEPNVTIFDNNTDGIKYDEIIFDSGYYFSHCEHHMVPFFGKYYFGYIPDKKILGLSKVARVVDYFSAKLQIQERLGEEIVEFIDNKVESRGMILIMEGRHLCKEMRGVKKFNSKMLTSKAKGLFMSKPELESKFIEMIKVIKDE